MELRYAFDPERYFLGKPCEHGHCWPGTDQSLRLIAYRGVRGGLNGPCMGCTGRKLSSWLISFIDYEASGFEPGHKLGKLCPADHKWNGQDVSLRSLDGKCVKCEVARKQKRVESGKQKESQRKWWASLNPEEKRRKSQASYLRLTDSSRQNRIDYKRQRREELKAQGLTTRGTAPKLPDPEMRQLRDAIRRAGRLPSVARLVLSAQRDYWRANPLAKLEYARTRNAERQRFLYLTNPEYRIYHRQKSKRRKAQERGSIGLHVTGSKIRERFAQFDGRCAYCGGTGDMQIEHLVPISRGGTHVLSNILPACQRCNFSKSNADAEAWYRAQPYFSQRRWARIKRVLGIGKGSSAQLTML